MNVQLHLNSKTADRFNGNIPNMNSQPTWFLKRFLPTRIDRRQTMYVSVMNASIPCTFLNCDYFNNTLIYYDNNNVEQTVVIPEGNYNVASLANWLNTSQSSPFSVTYNAITNHYTIQSKNNQPWTWSSESTCGELLGLTTDSNLQSSNTGSLTSDIGVNFFTIRNIIILCPTLLTNNINAQQQNNRSVLINIPVTAGANSMLVYQNTNNIRSELDSYGDMSNFQLALVDQDGDFIDLNGSHWSISLLFQIE